MDERTGSGPAPEAPPAAPASPVRGRGDRVLRLAVLLLALAGLGLSAALTRLHLRVHADPGYRASCAISERFDCVTVATSSWSVFLGLPVAVWGVLAYLGFAALAVGGLGRRATSPTWPSGLLFFGALAASIVSLLLFTVSALLIESACVLCLATYAINVSLLVVGGIDVRRRRTGPHRLLVADLRTVAERPRAWGAVAAALLALIAGLRLAYPCAEAPPLRGPGGLSVGRTAQGHPWIGAARPRAVIEEFSDYQCPHCRRGHRQARTLVAADPDGVRLVHRHFPLDHACNPLVPGRFHPQACAWARWAYCAGRQGRFWEANDFLFEHGGEGDRLTAEALAAATAIDAGRLRRCAASREAWRAVGADVEAGNRLGVHGTPTFVVDRQLHVGGLPRDVVLRAGAAGTGEGGPGG